MTLTAEQIHALDQEQTEREEREVLDRQADQNASLYGAGEFDGLIGSQPSSPEDHSYWEGYAAGLRRYYLKQQGKSITPEF